MIAVENVTYTYPKSTESALREVSFSVRQGSICAFLAPNGGGKTTLFKLLATMLPPQQGSILIGGETVSTQVKTFRKNLGVVFQSPGLDDQLTVEENLKLHARLYGMPPAEIRAGIGSSAELFGLTGYLNKRVEVLSGGYKRRVELAKSVLHKPALLLLDEPSTGLDIVSRKDLWNYLYALRDNRSTTVLVTTHLIDEAERADQVVILDRGKLVRSGSPAELLGEIPGEIMSVRTTAPTEFIGDLRTKWNIEGVYVDGIVRFEIPADRGLLQTIISEYFDKTESTTVSKPTLADVFYRLTGSAFDEADR